MNAFDRISLPDIQSELDGRNTAIDAVGIKGVRHPFAIRTSTGSLSTIATVSMTVGLAATTKGTHMSRFIEVLDKQNEPIDGCGFRLMTFLMIERLDARTGTIEMRFPYFRRKAAPVSAAESWLDYDVCWRGTVAGNGMYSFLATVIVPVTSLCPCSKEISEYGAHNQRSHITIEAEIEGEMAIEQLIAIAERSASCEVYGLLKRPDEKYVTERAYDNPKFVEDMVRDVAIGLTKQCEVVAFTVEVENFESIHNHSAFACIVRSKRAGSSAPTLANQRHAAS